MGLNNIENKDIEPYLHKNQPDIPEKTAEEIKTFFDALSVNVLIPKFNELIGEINKILPESEQAAQYAYSVGQVDELLSKKADKDELTPINESLDTKVDARFVEQKINDNKPADYIIEKGESGYWNYEKWNSGKLVCYGKTNATIKIDHALGSAYYSGSISIKFIEGFFNGAPAFVGVTPYTTGGLYSPVVQNLTRTGFTLLIHAPYSIPEETTYNISMYAVGKWK